MHQHIIHTFFPGKAISSCSPFGSGHINDTFKVELKDEAEHYILQRINTDIFQRPDQIIDTHRRLLEIEALKHGSLRIPKLIPITSGCYLFIDARGDAWRMTGFIRDSHAFELVNEPWQAYEAGKAYGWFARQCAVLNAASFSEPIRDFHRLSFRINQLKEAIASDAAGRLDAVSNMIDYFLGKAQSLIRIENMVDTGEIPLRIVHNDTKINNILFRDNKAVAVIDLDTTGPGILYYDYGDALRTSACTSLEDEKDLGKVGFNMEAFSAFTQAYMLQVRSIINPSEEEYFYLAPVLMTYIMGIRFLTDYLNGDTYYKTAYADHNLDRCKVQKALIEDMEKKHDAIREVIYVSLKKEEKIN